VGGALPGCDDSSEIEASAEKLLAVEEKFPGDVDQPVLDVDDEIGFLLALKPFLDGKGEEIVVKVLSQALELNSKRGVETASSGGLVEKAEELPAQLRHFSGGKVEILIMIERTSLGGADLEPLSFA